MVDENAMLDDIFAKVGQSADVIDLRPTFTDLTRTNTCISRPTTTGRPTARTVPMSSSAASRA